MKIENKNTLRDKLTFDFIINKFIAYRLFKLLTKFSQWISSDETFLKIYYRLAMGRALDLKNPKTFTEKLQKLKLLNKGQNFSMLVDKFQVREIIQHKLGTSYLIPMLGVWDNFDAINFDSLPNQFVLKTTHDSGTVIICTDKSKLDMNEVKIRLNRALKRNYFYLSREYPYRYALTRIVAEQYMFDESQKELDDYKFFCFDGEPKFVEITSGKGKNKQRGYYDFNLNPMPFTLGNASNNPITEDLNFIPEMEKIAKTLSAGLKHVRIDLYNINNQIFFGEYTFHHSGGLFEVKPVAWEEKIGDMIKL
jgi:hypothetical protein